MKKTKKTMLMAAAFVAAITCTGCTSVFDELTDGIIHQTKYGAVFSKSDSSSNNEVNTESDSNANKNNTEIEV